MVVPAADEARRKLEVVDVDDLAFRVGQSFFDQRRPLRLGNVLFLLLGSEDRCADQTRDHGT